MSLDPFRLLRHAARAMRVRKPLPSRAALLRSTLAICFARSGGPASVRLGPLRLFAPSRDELRHLFDEIFIHEEYLLPLGPDAGSTPVILDCGANIGFATLYLKLHHPGARITSFEPNPACFALLQRHIAENRLAEVTALQAACGPGEGEISFFSSPGFSPTGSIHASRGGGAQEIKVRLVRLSDHITSPVDLLKLDIEGAEQGVLDDLVSSGKIASIRRMVIEYHHRIGGSAPALGTFLRQIEDAGFTYDIAAPLKPTARFSGTFQDVMIYASRT